MVSDKKGICEEGMVNEKIVCIIPSNKMYMEQNEAVMCFVMVQHAMHRQYQLHSKLKQFGKRGEDAIQKGLNQLHILNTFYPVDEKKLSDKEKSIVLNSFMFLTKKRDSTIRACAYADGRK